MSATVGILAYGSLLSCPGSEIENALVDTIRKIETPFCVEFARKSRCRGYAPTLVPVEDGGARVMGSIYVVNVAVDTVLGTNKLSALVTNDLSGLAAVFFDGEAAEDETDALVTGDAAYAI